VLPEFEATDPPPLDELDRQLRSVSHRTQIMLTAFIVSLGVILIAFAIGVTVLLTGESRLSARASCEVTYNHQYAEVQQIRTGLTNSSDTAVENLIASVFTTPPNESQAQSMVRLEKAYKTYRTAEAQITLERKEHPVPAVPNC
jgi:hypothetical protein